MKASKFFRGSWNSRECAREREVLGGVRRTQEDVKIPAKQVKGSREPLGPPRAVKHSSARKAGRKGRGLAAVNRTRLISLIYSRRGAVARGMRLGADRLFVPVF